MDKKLRSFYCNKKVLITGADGYIGSNLVTVLQKLEAKIIIWRRKHESNQDRTTTGGIDVICGDISTESEWPKIAKKVDVIFHLAGQTSLSRASADPTSDFSINVLPVIKLVNYCFKNKLKTSIIFASTVTVNGVPNSIPVDETIVGTPITVYDIHKLISEKYLLSYAKQGFIKATVLRLPNIYGSEKNSSVTERGILNTMIRNAITGKKITIYEKGEYIRDYLYIDDAVNAFLLAGARIDKTTSHFFLLGTGVGTSIESSALLIKKVVKNILNRNVDLDYRTEKNLLQLIDKRNFIANYQKFSGLTGWKPRVSLREGIEKTINSLITSQP